MYFHQNRSNFVKPSTEYCPQKIRLILFSVRMQIQLETHLLARMDTEYIVYVIEDDLLEIRKK